MTALVAIVLVAVGVWGTVVVLTGDPLHQAVALSVSGLLLTVLFVLLLAPDVALSQLAVGSAVVPLMVLLAVRKISSDQARVAQPGAPDDPDHSDARHDADDSDARQAQDGQEHRA